ncbi:hypothetical protein DBV15_04144 [Temnothorax longispinosus]|uniref:Uncharacterized protein n=1 Tax=Temnothorax longispinosus TaxID=300112 RepID=A0A4S2KW83_9HYME|nr:hypothetical protein DBV15_04144 [Temnothorax longispinosus]
MERQREVAAADEEEEGRCGSTFNAHVTMTNPFTRIIIGDSPSVTGFAETKTKDARSMLGNTTRRSLQRFGRKGKADSSKIPLNDERTESIG